MASQYAKHFIPLESNPEIFTHLIHNLGVSRALRFEDVYALDDPSLLPHPALALVLTFPTTEDYESRRVVELLAAEKEGKSEHNVRDVIWFKQTIYNACGFYAVLHAVCNGEARNHIRPGSFLAKFLEDCTSVNPDERTQKLETSTELEQIYSEAARMGETDVSDDPEDEIDFHFVCFVKGNEGTAVVELDGDRPGPVQRGQLASPNEDLLTESCRRLIREYIDQRSGGNNIAFNLMVLTIDSQET